MTFEEIFQSWSLDEKLEWALGPNICNLSNQIRSIIVDLKNENARLKAQVPKFHDITKPLYTEDGVDYYDLPAEHGEYIVDCGGKECTYSEYDPDYNDWCDLVSTAKVTRWCEFPATEESSVTEKENG